MVEIIEIKKNKSFVAPETKIFKEEKNKFNAPVQTVKIDNISKNKSVDKKISKETLYIVIAQFYSKETQLNF